MGCVGELDAPAKLEQLEAVLTEEVVGLSYVHEHVLRSLSTISPISLRTVECEESPFS